MGETCLPLLSLFPLAAAVPEAPFPPLFFVTGGDFLSTFLAVLVFLLVLVSLPTFLLSPPSSSDESSSLLELALLFLAAGTGSDLRAFLVSIKKHENYLSFQFLAPGISQEILSTVFSQLLVNQFSILHQMTDDI